MDVVGVLDEDGKDVVDAVVEVENWEWECWGGGEHVDAGGTTDGAWGGDEKDRVRNIGYENIGYEKAGTKTSGTKMDRV